MFRRKNHTHRARREILDFTPMHRRNVQSMVGTVQREFLSTFSIIENDIETTACSDNELLQIPMGVTSTCRTARNVVKVIKTLDIERNVHATFDYAKVAALVVDNRDIYNLRFFPIHTANISY